MLVEMNSPMAYSGYRSSFLAAVYGLREKFDFRNPKVVLRGI